MARTEESTVPGRVGVALVAQRRRDLYL